MNAGIGHLLNRRHSDLDWRALGFITGLWLLLEVCVIFGGLTPPAFAATVDSAKFVGGPGSYTDPGTGLVYAKTGGTVTLKVMTSSDTRCIDVKLSDSKDKTSYTSKTATTSWSIDLTAPAQAGTLTASVSASPDFNNNGTCTGNTGGQGGGNQTTTLDVSYIIDNTGPVVTGTLNPVPSAAGWNKSDVAITWTATDPGGSGVASGPTPATDSLTENTAGVTKTSTATDNLGNVGSGSIAVKLDETLPTINATRNPAPNQFGWNNTDVTVSFTCSDALSGIKSCTGGGSTTVTTEGLDQKVAGTAVDNADNVDDAGVTLSIDKTTPLLSGAPVGEPTGSDANGVKWYNRDVTIKWTASDALSGLNGAAPADKTLTSEGRGLFATESVSDKADNTKTADSSPKVNIDKTAPVTNATAPSGWTNTDQTISLAPSDALSGVNTTTYTVDGGPEQTGTSVPVKGEGVHTIEFWSEDHARNVEARRSVTVKIDNTSPTITHTLTPAANEFGWNNTNTTVHFICDDKASGIKSCTPDTVISTEGKNQIVEGTAVDNAGNTAKDPAAVNLDKTNPTISAAADRKPNANLADNGNGWYDADVTVSFTCGDALSGVDVCPAAQTLKEGYDQSASGTAKDFAENTSSASVTGINVDKTAPALSGKPTTDANANGWYKADVTVAWTCSDALSKIDGQCPADTTITGEGSDLVASRSVSDRAGNLTTANSAPAVRIDRKAPSTSVSVPDPLSSGWYARPVTVTLTGVDHLSGVDKTFYDVDGGTPQEYTGPFQHALKGKHTIRFWSVDKAGNVEDKATPGHSITLMIDDIAPTITGAASPAANLKGWNNTPVTVLFTCTDAESGIAGCVGNTTLTQETTKDGTSVTGNASDIAGNTAEATVGPIKIDLTKPTLTGTPTTADNKFGWYKGDVTIKWTGQDGLSGIDEATVPANSTITGEGSGLEAGPETVKDIAGNTSDPTQSAAVNIDRTAPTISGATVNDDGTARSTNGAGWFSSSVRVRFSCDDKLSGVAECPGDAVLSEDGKGQSRSGTTTDKADNTANATVNGINIDSRAPETKAEIVCASKNGYCRGKEATVKLTASDRAPAEGVVTSGVKEIKYRVNNGSVVTVAGDSAAVIIPLNKNGTAIVEYWSIDHAGNSDDKPSPNKVELKYDTIAPVVSHTLDPLANAAGWNKANTTVTFTAVDQSDGSGVDESTITNPVLIDTETAGTLVNGSADDLAGNTGYDSVTVKLDKTNPTISATPSGTQGSNGWYTSAVTVAFTCAEPGSVASGIAICTGPQALGNGETATGKAVDFADNEATTEVGPFKVDTDAPVVTVKGVANGGEYKLGSVPTGSCEATDAVSGVDGSCSYSVTGGLANGVGTFNYTATAKDVAGNVTTVTGSYRVVYDIAQGTAFWLQPINDTAHTQSTTVSVFKAGSTVPAKFRLVDASGKAIQTNTAPVWLNPVKGSATTAAVDEITYTDPVTTGDAFKWQATDQHYQYNWASPKNGAGYYWRIGVKLDDGTVQTINIGLR